MRFASSIARPVERPKTVPVTFEHGPDIAATLRAWPAEHVAKLLVFYQPDDPPELRLATQEERVATLFRACVATGHELLLEVMWGIALWAAVHLAARGDVASLVFFGGFLVLALAGTALIDARKSDSLGEEWARFAAVTSNVPFSAIVEGRNHFSAGEIGARRVLAGLAAYGIVLVAHPWLFGVRAY